MLTDEQLEVIRQNTADEAAFRSIVSSLSKGFNFNNQPAHLHELKMLQTVFSSIPIGVTVHQTDGALLAFNRGALEILHLSEDQLEELDPRLPASWRIESPDGEPVELAALPGGKAITTGQAQQGELFRVVLANGSRIWVEVSAAPLYDEDDDRLHGVIACMMDVTRWQEAAAAEREQESLLFQLTQNMQEVFFIREEATQRFLYVSPAYETMWGRPIEELLADEKSLHDYMHPDDFEKYREERQEVRETKRPTERSFRIIRSDNEVRWISLRDFPILDESGEVVRIAAVAADVTDRVKREQVMQDLNDELEKRVAERTAALEEANKQLRELSKAKNSFVDNISHELKTPLTSIKLYLRLLDARPDKSEKYISVLHREGERLENIVENLLGISRLDGQAAPADKSLIMIDEMVKQFVEDRHYIAARSGITLQFYRQSLVSQTVMTDPALLSEVLGNVFTNAVNYTQAGGQITMVVRPKRTSAGEGVAIVVNDTGYGISAEEMPHIFDRFYRGDAAEITQTPGTGLGLSIAREILQRLGGAIEAHSDGIYEGATFEIWLPTQLDSSQA